MTSQRGKKKGEGTPPPPKAKRRLDAGKPKVEPFPLRPLQMLINGIEGARRAPIAMAVGALLPFLVSAPFMFGGQSLIADDELATGLAVSLIGLVLGGAASYPWSVYALHAVRNEPVDLAEPFRTPGRFFAMFVGSFWFWAGIVLGLQFFVIPAIAVFVFYAFFGFIIADRPDLGGLKALGTSVRIGDKRRIALMALCALFGFLLFLCIMPVGWGINPLTVGAMYLLLLIGMAVTVVAWASLYDVLRKDLPDAW